MTVEELADAYLKYFRTKSAEDSWSSEKVGDLCEDPVTGVEICLALIEQCRTNRELSFIAAAPIENMLKDHGSIVIPTFKQAAIASEKVRVALSGAWINDKDSVYEDWKDLMKSFGYWDYTPMSPLDRG
jgi:hypothetical protein